LKKPIIFNISQRVRGSRRKILMELSRKRKSRGEKVKSFSREEKWEGMTEGRNASAS
jgi:hypothetical protein